MEKQFGIITIIDNNNYGNRLQNYAVQTVLNYMKISKNEYKVELNKYFRYKS